MHVTGRLARGQTLRPSAFSTMRTPAGLDRHTCTRKWATVEAARRIRSLCSVAARGKRVFTHSCCWDKMAAMLQTAFTHAVSLIKPLRFDKDYTEVCNWGSRSINHLWFLYWLDAEQAISHYLNQRWHGLLTDMRHPASTMLSTNRMLVQSDIEMFCRNLYPSWLLEGSITKPRWVLPWQMIVIFGQIMYLQTIWKMNWFQRVQLCKVLTNHYLVTFFAILPC